MAPVYGVAAEAGDGGGDSKAVAGGGRPAGAGAELSGLGAAPGSRALVAAGIVGQAAALDGNQWQSAADRGLRIDREGSGEAGESLRDARVGRNAIRRGRPNACGKNFYRGKIARGSAGSRLCPNRRARDCGDAASHRGGGDRENETRRKVDQCGARVAAGRGGAAAGAGEWSAWRSGDRCCQAGAIAGAESALEGAEFVDHTTHQRGERPALGQAGRGLARIAGEMV